MKLYKEEGVNPMASCLPLLLQMPIFLGAVPRAERRRRAASPAATGFETEPELVDSLQNATIFGAAISAHVHADRRRSAPTQVRRASS